MAGYGQIQIGIQEEYGKMRSSGLSKVITAIVLSVTMVFLSVPAEAEAAKERVGVKGMTDTVLLVDSDGQGNLGAFLC